MHYITLDTNTWIYLANGTEPVRLLNYIDKEIEKKNITVLLPKIIITEWEKNKDKNVRQGSIKHFNDIKTALDRILKLLGDKGEKNIMSFLLDEEDEKDYFKDFIDNFDDKKKEIENAVSDNIKLIDKIFKNKATIIEIKDEIYKKSGRFALEKKAPFRQKNSFADALILFSFLDYVDCNSIKDSIFISYNTTDFCDKSEGKTFLHPHLTNEFAQVNSHFYKYVGEALNTIEKNIVSKEELDLIEEIQNEAHWNDEFEFCQICQENDSKLCSVFFGKADLVDNRVSGLTKTAPQPIHGRNRKSSKLKDQNSSIEVGNCDWCNGEHFKCIECGCVNAVWEEEFNRAKECEDCGLEYNVSRKYDRDLLEEIIYLIPRTTASCEKIKNKIRGFGSVDYWCRICILCPTCLILDVIGNEKIN